LKKVLKWLDNYLEMSICIILMSAMTLLVFVQVIMRYVFQNSLSWSEELARYLFIWLIYIGISYGCKIMKHIKIDAGLKLFPKKIRPLIVVLGDLLVLGFAIYIVITGYELILMQVRLHKVSPALQLPLQYVNAAPVAGFALAAVRQIQTIIYRIKSIKEGGAEEW
jgi:TRAP-type C4-dicarboxylate transport system permease small subunit